MLLDFLFANISKNLFACFFYWLINIKRRQICFLATFIRDKYQASFYLRSLNHNLLPILDIDTGAEGFGVDFVAGEGVDGAVGFIVLGICINIADACVFTAA